MRYENMTKLEKLRMAGLVFIGIISVPLAIITNYVGFTTFIVAVILSEGPKTYPNDYVKWFFNDTSIITSFFTNIYDRIAAPALETCIHFLQDKIPFIPDVIIDLQLGAIDVFLNAFTHNAVIMLLILFVFKIIPGVITWKNIEHDRRTIRRWKEKQNKQAP